MSRIGKYNKYNAKKVTIDGITFDSKHEAQRWAELRRMQQSKLITELRRQVKYTLIPVQRGPSPGIYKKGEHKGQPKPGKVIEQECAYIADFVYFNGSEMIVEDTKGIKTKDYIIKRKLMLYVHGIRVREV